MPAAPVLLFVASLVAAEPTPDSAAPADVRVVGARVISPDVYARVLPLLSSSTDPAAQAQALQSFLRASGYELATVRVGGPVPHLVIDEGYLHHVYYMGMSTIDAVQLKVLLRPTGNVFHRPELERQLARVREIPGFEGTYFEIVPFETDEEYGHDLQVRMAKDDWPVGLSGDLDYDSSDGLALRLNYAAKDAFLDDDRWQVTTQVGATYFEALDRGQRRMRLSKATLSGRWHTPDYFGIDLRPALFAYVHLRGRQRRDLLIENYNWLAAGTFGELRYAFKEGLVFKISVGPEFRYLFNIDQLSTDPPFDAVPELKEARAVANLGFQWDLGDRDLRRDRRPDLRLGAKTYLTSDVRRYHGSYTGVVPKGWHDYWIRVAAFGFVGDVPFADEEPIAPHIRGMFAYRYYALWLATAGLEYRHSLRRDLLKASGFVQAGGFGDPGRGDYNKGSKGVFVGGLGLHSLIADVVQLDLYYVLGATSDGGFDTGLSLLLSRAF